MSRLLIAAVSFLLAVMVTAGCTPTRSLGPVYIFPRGDQPAAIEVKVFSFDPNHLVILHDYAPASIRLSNTNDTWHNFTLTDPQEKVILSKNVIPKESITIRLDSLNPGNYVFYCNRFLHRLQGMEGMLMID
ncbi:MAG: hypothetical protein A2162_12205 [Deltaproteobacteria bacterium RBG_13_52_11b]|nr:MAG: hypothetical protein A2162_12205 [Deltaproteobacteria bacterium RBG_13_52_11b]